MFLLSLGRTTELDPAAMSFLDQGVDAGRTHTINIEASNAAGAPMRPSARPFDGSEPMRLLTAVAVMSVMLASGAEASECLDRSASQITVVSPGTYTTRFRKDAPADFHTFDMRGAEWRMDVRPEGKPVSVYQHLKGACISGAAVIGTQPRDASWDSVKNSDTPT